MRVKLLAAAGATALVLGAVSATLAPAPATALSSSTAVTAVQYANQHGYRSSIGVVDTQTGSFAGAGDYTSTYASESVMKTFIATRLLITGQMSGWNATTAYKMITQSDDASADALYGRTGGDSVITWIKQELNLPSLGSPPLRPGWWGGTQITASGMAQFYNVIRHRSDVWPWLSNAMHHATEYGSDGTYQFFGIPSATTSAGIKQGWGADDSAGQPAFNSTGFVNGDRYAVVILTQGGSYGSAIAGMLTSEARLLMPHGTIASSDPFGKVDSWSVHGRYLIVNGWALDPDAMASQLRIFFYVNSKPFTYVQTTVARGDVNSAYHTSGTHGFSKTLSLSDGANTVCAYAINAGAGSNVQLGCRSVPLNGNPLGGVSSVSQHGNIATFTGWAFDYDAPTSPLTVVAHRDGQFAGSVVSDVSRPDINAAFQGSGLHGYRIDVRLPAGASAVCLYAQNRGVGSQARIGCHDFSVPVSPVGNFERITVQANQAHLTGWMFDFNDTGRSIGLVIDDNGQHRFWGPTTVSRPDVDAAYRITGVHGFDFTLPLSPGTNRICVSGVNIGAGSNSSFGCQTVTGAVTTSATAPRPPASPAPTVSPAQPAAPPSATPASSKAAPSGSGSGS